MSGHDLRSERRVRQVKRPVLGGGDGGVGGD